MGGAQGIPLYLTEDQAAQNTHIKISSATPQFQRKLEAPLRAALLVINEATGPVESRACTILWKSLTIMEPQIEKAFDHSALPCFRLNYAQQEDGRMTLEVFCTESFAAWAEEELDQPADPSAIDAGNTVWARAWNKQMYGSVVQYDVAEQAATGGAAAAAEMANKGYNAKGKGKGKNSFNLGKGKHLSTQFVNVDRDRPFAIDTKMRVVNADQIGFNWNEYVDKFGKQQYRTGDGTPPPDRLLQDHAAQATREEAPQEQREQPPLPPPRASAEAAGAAGAAGQGLPPRADAQAVQAGGHGAPPTPTTQPELTALLRNQNSAQSCTVEQAITWLMTEQQLLEASQANEGQQKYMHPVNIMQPGTPS